MHTRPIRKSLAVVPSGQPGRPVRRHGGTVLRRQTSLARERGWFRKHSGPRGEEYLGYFRAAGRRFEGKATVTAAGAELYVRNIPPELSYHSHRDCFMARKDGWFWVHHDRNSTLDSAILEIEAILTEAITKYGHLPSPPRGSRRTRTHVITFSLRQLINLFK